nr:MAG TPA: restriction alleviation protein [Bacteriophage sp.]
MRVLLLVSRSIWTLDRWRPLCRCIKTTLRRDFLNDHPPEESGGHHAATAGRRMNDLKSCPFCDSKVCLLVNM